AGLGLEEKYSIAFFVIGMIIGLLLTEQRRFLLSKWLWLGGAAGFLLFLANLLWDIYFHLPFLQLIHTIRAEGRDVVLGPLQFFYAQLLIVTPVTALVWIAGLIALLLYRPLKPYRVLGWCYLVTYGIFYALHGKDYYLSPIYPMLFAA